MAKRKVSNVYSTVREDIADLVTRRALPTQEVQMIDPFLFLNHHGPQVYPQDNQGLPFGPHPHRGFETVTFILHGQLAHEDTGGHRSVINAGGVQWMTAGRGLVHAELSPQEFQKSGGDLEILQLWVNLPSQLKMTDPKYTGLQAQEIPKVFLNEDRVQVDLISGHIAGKTGPIRSLTDVHSMVLNFSKGGRLNLTIPLDRNIFFYVIAGQVDVNGSSVEKFHLVGFDQSGDEIEIKADQDSKILLCHAQPCNEPVASYGPFVMNTKEEIIQAIRDYEAGMFN